jgi:hypothetical protein
MLQKHIEDQSNASPPRTTSQCKNDYDASGKDDTKSSPSPIHDTTPDTTLESTSGNSSDPDSGCLSDTDIEARSGTDFEGHSEAKVDTFTEGNGKEIVSRQTVSHRRQSLARQPRPFPFYNYLRKSEIRYTDCFAMERSALAARDARSTTTMVSIYRKPTVRSTRRCGFFYMSYWFYTSMSITSSLTGSPTR